ncbi:hypothetical protein [Embleya hyalina]|uniref:Uncharacterized protein n=1 Tax=Embleya hyalina TaxID=516124 RepID=A0A401YWH2_9ACTN|nr:hypothetical protein [Embleya hyalina]GCD98920.1 hypothetical protein EHYA_06632 [Embleya hyalina]
MGSGAADGGTGGHGPNGGQPGPSPFGPLELPRDETEVLPRFEDYADQGPPEQYGQGAYPGQPQGYPGQQQPYPGQQPYSGQQSFPGQQGYPGQQPYPAQQPPAPGQHDPNGLFRPEPGQPQPPAAPGQMPPRPMHTPPGGAAVGSPLAPPGTGPQPAGAADPTQVFEVSLFRDEVAGSPPAGTGPVGIPAPPIRPAYSGQPAPPSGGYPAAQSAGYAAPQPAAPQYGPHTVPPVDHGGPGRGRTPLIAAGVGALVVVAAIGVFASGAFGDDDKSDKADKGAAATAGPKPETSGSGAPGTSTPPAKANEGAAQASAVDRLLQSGAGSRQVVSQAVQKIQKCDDPAAGAQSLNEAARQRDQQLAGLDKLTTDKLTRGADLVAGLREAWTASAESDRELAAWGNEMAHGGCKDHKAEYTDHKRAADRAGGRATTAKNKVVGLWNPIAADNNLGKRSAGDF